MKLLVVDDEPDLQALIEVKFRKAIKNKEFEFFFAANGQEALEILKKNGDINIILTDINMPVMDGLVLLENLHSLNRPYKAVVVSAYGDMSNIRVAMNKGASDFVMKPIDFIDFELTIRKMIDEFGTLSDALIAEARLKDIQKELDVARAIQESMLPNDFIPLPKYPLQIEGKMIPAKEVGGDLYDFFPIDDHRLAIFIADVSGKSISACLYMVLTKLLFRALTKKNPCSVEVMAQLNELLTADNRSNMFVTAFYAILDLETGELRYCNAGHNWPFLLRKNGDFQMIGQEKSLALGITDPPVVPYQEHVDKLEREEALFLYTDGVTEAMNSNRELFTEQRLVEILKGKVWSSAKEIMSAVDQNLKGFVGGAPQSDDITMAVFKRG